MQKVRRHSYLSRISTAYRVTNSRSISPVHRPNFIALALVLNLNLNLNLLFSCKAIFERPYLVLLLT
jgi:hypothetical protein